MADKVHSLTVIFEDDVSQEHIDQITKVMMWMKGAILVIPNVSDFNSVMAVGRAKFELKNKLWDVLK